VPLVRDPVNTNVLIDWRGDELTGRVRRGIRAGMIQQARGAVLMAKELVNKDTEALMDAITFRFGRGSSSGVYSLEFGVFDDPTNRPRIAPASWWGHNKQGAATIVGSGEDRVEMPQDYAFWQEVMPGVGNPYIRPAVDVFFSESNLFLAIAGNIFYQRAGYGSDALVDFGVSTETSGLDQPLAGAIR
jgi:hypothetical protein